MRCWSLEIALSLIICHRCGGQTSNAALASTSLIPSRILATTRHRGIPAQTNKHLIQYPHWCFKLLPALLHLKTEARIQVWESHSHFTVKSDNNKPPQCTPPFMIVLFQRDTLRPERNLSSFDYGRCPQITGPWLLHSCKTVTSFMATST